jgi:ER lumen protein retaining receptor
MRCFGFFVLNYRMWTMKSAKGVSVKTLELYGLTFIARLLSILRHQGYLPFDKTGDWFYHVVEIISFASVVLGLYAIFGPMMSTYDEKHDKFGNLHIPSEFGIVYLVVPCVILACLFHP